MMKVLELRYLGLIAQGVGDERWELVLNNRRSFCFIYLEF